MFSARPKQASVNRTSLRDTFKADITKLASIGTAVQLSPPPPLGFTYLANLASVIRTKNCGPFELTMDVMFPDTTAYKMVQEARVLNKETLATLYGLKDLSHVIACLWWEPALAFKATIKRPVISGSFDDNDVHGSGAHVPLMYLQIPL
jgi:hypothetical protein